MFCTRIPFVTLDALRIVGAWALCGIAACDGDKSEYATPPETGGKGSSEKGSDSDAVSFPTGADGAPLESLDSGERFPSGARSDGGALDGDWLDGGPSPDSSEHCLPDAGVLHPTEVPFDEAYLDRLSVPAGFAISVFAMPGGQTRMLTTHHETVYVTRPAQGDVLSLVDQDGDGMAEASTAIDGLPMVHGIAFTFTHEVYLATPNELLRGKLGVGGAFESIEVLVDDLPDGGEHPLRTLGIGPDGLVYVSVGSSCDACAEVNPEHATMLQVATDGSWRTIFASGLRNTLAFGWQPQTSQLWGIDQASDFRGNDVPPEELNLIEFGMNYGWPYCYDDRVDPVMEDPPEQAKAAYCETTRPPTLTWSKHEGPTGLTFYDREGFPPAFRGDAFVAMHGSWSHFPASGYSIARVDFVNGSPVEVTDFVVGFLSEAGCSTFGRPAGITTHPEEGSLLFSDDSNGVIYRIARTQ